MAQSPKSPTWLLGYASNVYSQSGEDGIILKILETLGESDKWCVEFGAWDGRNLSNTCNLILNKGYSAVLIESSKARFVQLQKNYALNKNVYTINRFVGFEDEDNLDHILNMTPIPRNFDFLSIDVDGNDYHVWKAISKYEPKAICIEYNPTIPTEIRFIQPADQAVNQGSSLLSLVELGKEKGYELVSVLLFNALFVKSKYYRLFEIADNAPTVLRTDSSRITHLFSGFDGTIFLGGYMKLPWHDIQLKESKIQHLPRLVRKYPDSRGKIDLIIWRMYLLLTDPRRLVKYILKRIVLLIVRISRLYRCVNGKSRTAKGNRP